MSDELDAARASLDGSGWTLDAEGTFVRERGGKRSDLRVVIRGLRARVVDPDGAALWSGPPARVRNFTRAFWFTP
jgi:hypothetical protein